MQSINDVGLHIGDSAPDFELPGVDGKDHSMSEYSDKEILVVMFTCNHCPYVRANESRLIDIQNNYASRDVTLVAINSNETVNYPEDDFDHMVERAKKLGYNFHYLRDENQAIAKAYGAQCTPEMFLFDKDRKLRYRGGVDDNWKEPEKVQRKFLREALDATLEGKNIDSTWAPAIGCSIKWIQ